MCLWDIYSLVKNNLRCMLEQSVAETRTYRDASSYRNRACQNRRRLFYLLTQE